jgi:hypothetical protein
VALKRQYLGLFWERFLVEDREIIKACPSPLIRELHEKHSVILSSIKRGDPPVILTLLDAAYMKELREKLDAIKVLKAEAASNSN